MTRNNSAVWLENQNRWQIKIQKDGVRKTFTSSLPGRAGKAEANRKADEWLASQTTGGNALASVLWGKWYDSITSDDAKMKARSYWNLYVSPVFGKRAISKITEGDFQEIVNSAVKKGLSFKYISNIRTTLSAFSKWLRMNRYANLTTIDVTISKSAKRGTKEILQPDDIKKLWDESDSVYINMFRLAVLTGMRPGELIGLKWSDIDGNKIHIQRAINDHGKITTGKNSNAIRSIWLGDYESDVLDKQRTLLKRRSIISPWVFPNEDGNHTLRTNVYQSWNIFKEKAGISSNVTPYGWRHTFVSINNDMPAGLKRRLVGHSVGMDTEGVYGHAVVGEDEQAAEYVKKKFDAILQKPTV